MLQVRPNLLLVYERTEYFTGSRKKREPKALENFRKKKAYAGMITEESAKKLKRAIQLLLASAKPKQHLNPKTNKWYTFKVNFITLTLPCDQGNITDKELKSQVLDPWIKTARRQFKLGNYVWRAERQLNGNLHFHLTTETFIPYDQLRNTWNAKLERLGMISTFEKKWHHRSPNSTDVHAIHKIKNLAGYMSKYMTKAAIECPRYHKTTPLHFPIIDHPYSLSGSIPPSVKLFLFHRIDGKVWDCSKGLKTKGWTEFLLEEEGHNIWQTALAERFDQYHKNEFCDMIFNNGGDPQVFLQGSQKSKYIEWLDIIRRPEPIEIETPKFQPDTLRGKTKERREIEG